MISKYGYVPKLHSDLKGHQKTVSHSIFMGTSGSGKNHTIYNFAEEGLNLGVIKFWNLWCCDWQHLQEVLTLMFPSKEHFNKFSKSKVKPYKDKNKLQHPVRIYVPVSDKMPKFGYDGFIVPFTISLDNLTDDCIRLLCANKSMDYGGYISEFRNMMTKGMTLPDLKRAMMQSTKGKGVIKEKGFDEEKWTQSHKGQYGIQQFLMRRIGVLDKEGVIANKGFPYALENHLDKEIFDKDTIVVLYLGAVENESIRSLIYIYFLECLRRVLERKQGNKFKFKNVIYMNELETLTKPDSGKNATPVDMVVNDYLKRMASVGRHLNMEMWGDCKSPDFVDKSILAIFKNEYVTSIDNRFEIRRLGERADNFGEKELHRYMVQVRRRKAYRFIDLHNEMPRWFFGNTIQLGFELIRPRICMDGKVDMKYNDFTSLNGIPTYKVLGLDFDDRFKTKEIKDMLRDLWKKGDEKLEAYIVKSLEKPDKEKKQDKEEVFIERLEKLLSLKKNYESQGKKLKRIDMAMYVGYKNVQNLYPALFDPLKVRLSSGEVALEKFRELLED